jgi:effector-binding domain-containing protein
MTDRVSLVEVEVRPTAVVCATTTWQQFPTVWGPLLGEVWDCLRAAGITGGCRNVMLYRDDVLHRDVLHGDVRHRDHVPSVDVEVGVLLGQPCPLAGRVVASSLPAGTAATAVHRGSFAGVWAAHDAVRQWCRDRGSRPTGTRWEIYGPHHDDPAQQWTEVYWLL